MPTYESEIEAHVVDEYNKANGIPYKFTSPGRRGVPDRLCLKEITDPEHRKIVARYVKFIECKAPGKKPRKDQINEISRLIKLGYDVEIVDSKKWKLK